MKKLSYSLIVLSVALGGCVSNSDDLNEWMNTQAKSLKGSVAPLPPVAPFVPVSFTGVEMPDPFLPLQNSKVTGVNAPDENRKKEFLESFSLESLNMVGMVIDKGEANALIKTPDNNVNIVKAGNYLGKDFGRIILIENGRVLLIETYQDGASGEWREREATLTLVEAGGK